MVMAVSSFVMEIWMMVMMMILMMMILMMILMMIMMMMILMMMIMIIRMIAILLLVLLLVLAFLVPSPGSWLEVKVRLKVRCLDPSIFAGGWRCHRQRHAHGQGRWEKDALARTLALALARPLASICLGPAISPKLEDGDGVGPRHGTGKGGGKG